MVKRYLVFISSTYEDLKTERMELKRIVSELGAIPVTADAFDISQEDDRRAIKKFIEDCDYFINLTAHKAGEAVGGSFALEYEYSCAIKAMVPVLALIIGDKARWKASKKEKDASVSKALEAFKKKLESHVHDKWSSLADLKQKAVFLLSREMNLNPQGGWVPSLEAAEPSVANELSRLSRENENLKNLLKMEGTDIVKKIHKQIRETLKVLAGNRISLSFYYTNGENWENTCVFRHLRLFRLLTPELSVPKTAAEISHFLGNILNPDLEKDVRKKYPTPSNTIKKIMTDFALLKLVKHSVKETSKGQKDAWEMTEYGREAFSVYRMRQMKRPASAKAAEPLPAAAAETSKKDKPKAQSKAPPKAQREVKQETQRKDKQEHQRGV